VVQEASEGGGGLRVALNHRLLVRGAGGVLTTPFADGPQRVRDRLVVVSPGADGAGDQQGQPQQEEYTKDRDQRHRQLALAGLQLVKALAQRHLPSPSSLFFTTFFGPPSSGHATSNSSTY